MTSPIARRFAVHDTNLWPPERPATPRPAPRPAPTPAASTPGVKHLGTPRATSEIGRRMDAFHEQMKGPYVVDGKTYDVQPAFRSLFESTNTAPALEKIKRAVGSAAFSRIAMNAARAVGSRGTPNDVRVTVQALIDAGALGKGEPREAIRTLMLAFDIGFDCKGYTYRSFLYSRGTGDKPASGARYHMADVGNVNFPRTPGLSRVKIEAARTGDIIRLKPDSDGRDHNVIVRSNQVTTLSPGEELEVKGQKFPPSFTKNGGKPANIRVMELDSSWGGGVGVARRVWVRNESSGQWGFFSSKGEFVTSPGPYAHELDGVFRPKSE